MPIDFNEMTRPKGFMGLSPQEVWMLFGALSVLVVSLLVWAVYFRKPRTPSRPYLTERPVRTKHGRSGRRRRRRREHRPLNPTLAQTGGLPPVRPGPPPGP